MAWSDESTGSSVSSNAYGIITQGNQNSSRCSSSDLRSVQNKHGEDIPADDVKWMGKGSRMNCVDTLVPV